jgi:hypothetical protein
MQVQICPQLTGERYPSGLPSQLPRISMQADVAEGVSLLQVQTYRCALIAKMICIAHTMWNQVLPA